MLESIEQHEVINVLHYNHVHHLNKKNMAVLNLPVAKCGHFK